MPKQLFSPATEREICLYYWTRLPSGYYPSYKEVAEHFDCSAPHVRNLLKKHHYERRTNTETREGRPCKRPYERGEAPACACGCGQNVSWDTANHHWRKYIRGHYRPKALYHSAEWLRNEYVEKSRTADEIASECHVGQSSILKAMHKAGIKPRTLSESLILRGSTRGEKNPAWKGGVAEWEYSPDWKRICKEIKDRDKWTCQGCGECRTHWGVHLHVHHVDGDKLNNHPDNLISLCAKCHRIAHGAKP